MSKPDFKCEVLVVGGGVMGLACARRIAEAGKETFLIESLPQFGQGTSSRNSEVIHSGIYYPASSQKTKHCIRGRELLYDFAKKFDVHVEKFGKFVVATKAEEESYLETLAEHCREVSVPFEAVSGTNIQKEEPLVEVKSGLYFPESGVMDSHGLMAALERLLLDAGGTAVYHHRLQGLKRDSSGWVAEIAGPDESMHVGADVVVNAAGLASAEIWQMATGQTTYTHRFCRGRYMVLPSSYRNKFRHLIYPVPQRDGLGVHVTIDFDGGVRLGPDVDWSDDHRYENHEVLYQCDWSQLGVPFREAASRYVPSLSQVELEPGLIGIRAKLFVGGEAHRDFVIREDDGLISCLGIESPGLTSSLSLAEEVSMILGS